MIELSEPRSTYNHPLVEHEDALDHSSDSVHELSTLEPKLSGSSSSVPAVQLADTGLSNTISPRIRSIKTLARLIDEHAMVHARRTPSSGKSTVAKLLFRHYSRHYLTQRRPIIAFVVDWRDGAQNNIDTVGFLVRQCQDLGLKIQRAEFLNEAIDDIIFVLDEAQVARADSFFGIP